MTDELELQNFLPYLLNRAGVQTGLNFSVALRKYRLTLQDWRILIALWQNDGMRLRDMVEITSVDNSTLSRQISSLQKKGLIARAKSDSDARALCIALTAKGRNLTAKIIPTARAQASAATHGLSGAQLENLAHCLNVIFNNLKKFKDGKIGEIG